MAESSIVLITGGNTGIGYETIKALYASSQPYTILMGSRSLEKAKDAILKLNSEVSESKSEVKAIQLDIEDDASIEKAFEEVKNRYGRLDTLVNNAGGSFDRILQDDYSPKGIRAAWDSTYSLNVTSTQVVTHTFAPLLVASTSPRLIFVSSALSSLTTCAGGFDFKGVNTAPPKGWPKPLSLTPTAYRCSKTALNILMLYWARTLYADGARVFCVSPGFMATGLGGMGPDFLKNMGAADASVGGEFIRHVVEGKRDEDTGKVIDKDGVQPW